MFCNSYILQLLYFRILMFCNLKIFIFGYFIILHFCISILFHQHIGHSTNKDSYITQSYKVISYNNTRTSSSLSGLRSGCASERFFNCSQYFLRSFVKVMV